MPAKVGDPVNVALRLSLAAGDASGDLDKRLVSSAHQVLSAQVEYMKGETSTSSILDSLKQKYVSLNTESTSSPISNGRPGTPRLLPDSGVNTVEMCPDSGAVLPTPKVILYPSDKIQLGWRGNCPVGSGMMNVGNTCYLNACLQALFHVPALVNWLHSDSSHLAKCSFSNGSIQAECLICAVNKTFKASQNKSGNVIKPYLIINRLKSICKQFTHGQQEDAHEFLRHLIERMGEAYVARVGGNNLDVPSKETTPVNQILGGYIRSDVTCLICRGASTHFEYYQELMLEIRRASTLDDALANFFERERLDGDNAYQCDKCCKKTPAIKKYSIERPSKVLILQFKRFNGIVGKLNKHVSFTQRLDITRFLWSRSTRPLTYRLVSMVTHMGSSLHCGHYTAIAQTSSGQFYHFDDSSVRPISLNSALDSNSYVIIYEMERPDSCPPPSPSPAPKPATITSGSSLFNGNSPRSVNLPVLSPPASTLKMSPTRPRPGPSRLPEVHKPTPLLPPVKERDRVSFGLQPRLVMHIKNGKVCPPGAASATKSSLVPYDSGDSSGSDSEKKPDMPSLDDATATSSSFLSPKSSSSSSFNLFAKTAPPKSPELTNKSAQKSAAKATSSAETSKSPSHENCMVSPAKFVNSGRKSETELSSVRRKIFDADVPPSEGLHVNTVVSSSRSMKASWQVTDVALHSPSCHSESSTNSVASSTTSWAVSDMKRTSSPAKRPPCQTTKPPAQHQETSPLLPPPAATKTVPHCNGIADGTKKEEYEWVEKTKESLSRCNGQVNGWSENGGKDVVSHLSRHSHQGYGPSVNSWSGGRTHVDREVDSDRREERKRSFSKQYDDEMDMGRVKKVKHRDDYNDNSSHKTNRFDEYHKNSWNDFRMSSSSFYNNSHRSFHSNKKYRNNHGYNNGYYRRKYASHHHPYYRNKQDRWRR